MAKPRPVALSPNARQDALDAYDWYRERSPRAAEQFAYALEQAIKIIGQLPTAWPVVDQELGTRRYVLRKFPYTVLYNVGDTGVIIEAVFHARQHPSAWFERD